MKDKQCLIFKWTHNKDYGFMFVPSLQRAFDMSFEST